MPIFYKFRSEKAFGKIETDRPSIPLWELKAEIVALRHLTLHDFYLVFYPENDSAPIADNYAPVYSNTSVVVERIPNHVHRAARLAGDAPAQARLAGDGAADAPGRPDAQPDALSISATPALRPPPAFYTCFRCGQKGHYIQACPTNTDKQYDTMRVRKATGIPRAFLVPAADSSSSVLLNEEGKFVRAEPQTREFSRYLGRGAGAARAQAPEEFRCGECGNTMVLPVLLSCGHSTCEACTPQSCAVCGQPVASANEHKELRRAIEGFFENFSGAPRRRAG